MTEYTPHLSAGSFGVMPTFGLTVTAQSPDPRFAITVNGFGGAGNLNYTDHQIINSAVAYHMRREDGSIQLEYTPHESNVTFVGGVRYVDLQIRERGTVVTFASNYEDKMTVAEIGARIAGRVTPGSHHILSAQALVGFGYGTYNENTTGLTPLSKNGFALTGEFSLGYNYLISDRATFGLRGRAFIFQTGGSGARAPNQFGERSGAALGPELNLSYRF